MLKNQKAQTMTTELSNKQLLEIAVKKLNDHDLDLHEKKMPNRKSLYKIVTLWNHPLYEQGFDGCPNDLTASTIRESLAMVRGFLLAKGYGYNPETQRFDAEWPVNEVLRFGEDRRAKRIWATREQARTERREFAEAQAKEQGVEFICPPHLIPALPGEDKSIWPEKPKDDLQAEVVKP